MASGDIKVFTISENGFTLTVEAIDLGDGTTQFNITSVVGTGDVNAIWWSDGDTSAEGDTTLTKSFNALNMNGTGEVWDGVEILSKAGLGTEGEDKSTFLSEGETLSYTVEVDWDSLDTVGIRATSVNGGDSIKGVADDPVVIEFPDITVSDAEVEEGEEASVTVSLSHDDYPYDITVNYETSDGTAGSGDYTGATGSVTFVAGDTSETITIATTEDGDDESNETFNVTLTGATADIPGPDLDVSGSISDDTGVVTIIDDDEPAPVGQNPPPTTEFDNDGLTLTATTTTWNASTGGDDVKVGDSGNNVINGGNGEDTLLGGSGIDTLNGNNQDDDLYGQVGNDVLSGGGGNDSLYGGSGDDSLAGNVGNDTQYGGSGADTYVFDDGDSLAPTGDSIIGWDNLDTLDFSLVDANAGVLTDQAFAGITASSTVSANSLNYYYVGADTIVQGDTDGIVGTVEVQVTLVGVNALLDSGGVNDNVVL